MTAHIIDICARKAAADLASDSAHIPLIQAVIAKHFTAMRLHNRILRWLRGRI